MSFFFVFWSERYFGSFITCSFPAQKPPAAIKCVIPTVEYNSRAPKMMISDRTHILDFITWNRKHINTSAPGNFGNSLSFGIPRTPPCLKKESFWYTIAYPVTVFYQGRTYIVLFPKHAKHYSPAPLDCFSRQLKYALASRTERKHFDSQKTACTNVSTYHGSQTWSHWAQMVSLIAGLLFLFSNTVINCQININCLHIM